MQLAVLALLASASIVVADRIVEGGWNCTDPSATYCGDDRSIIRCQFLQIDDPNNSDSGYLPDGLDCSYIQASTHGVSGIPYCSQLTPTFARCLFRQRDEQPSVATTSAAPVASPLSSSPSPASSSSSSSAAVIPPSSSAAPSALVSAALTAAARPAATHALESTVYVTVCTESSTKTLASTGSPTKPTSSLPAFTGAASIQKAGAFVAGVGALAAALL